MRLMICYSLLQMYCIGVSSLQLFVQSNWLGCHSQYFDSTIPLESIKQELILDGESLIPSLKNLPCLLIAKVILHNLKQKFQSFKVILHMILLVNFNRMPFYSSISSWQTGGFFDMFLYIRKH